MNIIDVFLNPIVLGFIIGSFTNGIAIKMLFRPYTKVGLGFFAWQGLIPKRQPEIAAKIAKVITTKLLTPQKIAEKFDEPNVKENIRKMNRSIFFEIFDYEFMALNNYLTPYDKTRLAEALALALERLTLQFENWLVSEEGKAWLLAKLSNLLNYKLSEILKFSKNDFNIYSNQLFDFISEFENLKVFIKALLGNILVELSNSNKPISEILSPEAKKIIDDEVEKLIPIIHLKIKQSVLSQENIEKIKKVVLSSVEKEFDISNINANEFSNFIEIGAKIMLKKPVLDKVNAIFDSNLLELEKSLDSERTKDQIRNSVKSLVDNLLQQTPAKILEGRDLAQLDFILENLTELLLKVIRSSKSRETFVENLSNWFDRFSETSLSNALEKFSLAFDQNLLENKLISSVINLAKSNKISKYLKKESWWLFDVVINFPIGRISRFANLEIFNMIFEILEDHITNTIVTKAADLINSIDIEEIIKEELLNYPPQQLERLVLEISSKELKAITYLGGVLGSLIGLLQYLNLN